MGEVGVGRQFESGRPTAKFTAILQGIWRWGRCDASFVRSTLQWRRSADVARRERASKAILDGFVFQTAASVESCLSDLALLFRLDSLHFPTSIVSRGRFNKRRRRT